MRTIPIPDYFKQFRLKMGGNNSEWIDKLPELLSKIAEEWQLSDITPFPNLSYNYAAFAVRTDGTRVVLKADYPHDKESKTEIAALRICYGHGMAQILEVDEVSCIFLLEKLEPGKPLATITYDEEATRIAANVMKELWQPVPDRHNFPSIQDWGNGFGRIRERFDGSTGPLPEHLVDKASQLFSELSASMDTSVVLHGDLHHDNILSAQREPWLAIDPKGVIGEPAYETGALLRNPLLILLKQQNPKEVLERRISILSEELGFDKKRIHGWGLSQAVLSAWWNVEDNIPGKLDTILTCAEILDEIKV